MLLFLLQSEKRQLLSFATGSDRAPIKGLGSLRFVISRMGPDSEMYAGQGVAWVVGGVSCVSCVSLVCLLCDDERVLRWCVIACDLTGTDAVLCVVWCGCDVQASNFAHVFQSPLAA